MIELLTSGGVKESSYFPDSGPGTKTLQYGNEDFGYFGVLSVDEFMQFGELRRQLNFYDGNQTNLTNNEWVKAIFNKKVLFFPRKYISANISWNTLYNAGLVHGVDGPGPFQSPNGPTNQQRIVNAKASNFRVRLFAADITDPSPQTATHTWGSTGSQAAINMNNSEFGTILNGLISSAPAAWTGVKWKVLSADSFFNGVNGSTQMTQAANNLNMQAASASSTLVIIGKALACAWIPVLELIPANEIIVQAVADVETLAVSELSPVTVTEIIQNVGLQAIRDPAVLATGLDAVHSVTITYS
jgi:hypothetical protein